MFSTKVYVLSVSVLSLFTLGQAAPVYDEISSLSTREFSSLETRGFFDGLFGRKADPATKNVSIDANCQLYNIYATLEGGHKAAHKLMTEKVGNVTNKPTPVQAAYKKKAKQFEKSAKKVEKKIDGLKKKVLETWCQV